MKDYIKKADIVLAAVLAVLCGLLCWFVYGTGQPGKEVEIRHDGEVWGHYSLYQPQVIDIDTKDGHNQVTIKDGKVFMSEADCPDGYCLNQHKAQGGIDSSNESIVCLPNKLVISVTGGKAEDGIDATSGTPSTGGENNG